MFFVILAAFLWGTIGVFVYAFTAMGLNSWEISALRALTAFGFIALFLAMRRPEAFRIRWKDLWIFFGTGIFSFTAMNVSYFYAIRLSGLMTAAVLLYTSPAFIAALSALFFHEKISALKGAAIALAVGGSALIAGITSGLPREGLVGIFWGLGAGLSYALYSIFGRAAFNRKYSADTLTFYTFAFAAGAGLFFVQKESFTRLASPRGIGLAALFGLLCTVLPFLFYSKGLQRMSNTSAGVAACFEPVAASVLGIVFYGELLALPKALGAAAVAAAVFLLSWKKGSR